MSDRWFGFVSGVLATILGFVFTMVWDAYKDARETTQLEATVLKAAHSDLSANLQAASDISKLVNQEISIIDNGRTLVQPLPRISNGFWDLLRLHVPASFNEKPETFLLVQKVAVSGAYINEVVTSRENWRVNNQSMSNFPTRLKIYDNDLLSLIGQYNNDVTSLLNSEPLK